MDTINSLALAIAALCLAACTATGSSISGPITTTPGYVLLEMSDAAPERMTGVLNRGDTFAVHTITALHGVVLEADVDGPVRPLRAGSPLAATILSRVRTAETGLPPDAGQLIWCDIKQHRTTRYEPRRANCFADEDQDGRFDQAYVGLNTRDWSFLDLHRFTRAPDGMMSGPVDIPYRRAAPTELASAQLAFRYCGGDNDRSPPRFAIVGSIGNGWASNESPCAFGAWPDLQPSSTIHLTDTIRINVEATRGGLAYAVEGRFEPGLLSSAFRLLEPRLFGGSVSTETPTGRLVRVSPDQERIVADGEAEVMVGERAVGTVLVQQPVRFRYTGVLASQVRQSAGLGLRRGSLEVGTPVFGIPLVAEEAENPQNIPLSWCAPRFETNGASREIRTICLVPSGTQSWWGQAHDPYFPTSAEVAQTSQQAPVPVVDQREVDLGFQMVQKVFLHRWTARRAVVDLVLEAGPETYRLQRINVLRVEDGSAPFEILGRRIRMTQPDPDDNHRAIVEHYAP